MSEDPFCHTLAHIAIHIGNQNIPILGLHGAPKISVLRGSEGTVRVSVPEFRISVRFILYIALSKLQWWRWKNNIFFEASDSKWPVMLIMKYLLQLVCLNTTFSITDCIFCKEVTFRDFLWPVITTKRVRRTMCSIEFDICRVVQGSWEWINSRVHHSKTHLCQVFVEYQMSRRITWIFIFNIEDGWLVGWLFWGLTSI